ncbi:glycoside hydrolase family 5 protein [Streptomyces coffeae]|uniref:Glycoside hydrolase family 5 protein n=1 Tax=Streptomyces coffeae TaxID=621382 RepID=A0ABS1NEI3_9ACTN|nr:glycoside hydrolase family 5 protein [Streptomyces coffeae]MBL1098339.1 glycoside hydrolase family 5 protein [Streptomyces coffeae]
MHKRSRRLLLTETAAALAAASGPADQAEAATGIHVSNGRVVEANGNDFVMRGVNHPHAWYTDRTGSLAHIKGKEANTVRVVLASGQQWTMTSAAEVSTIVSLCKRNRLICVLEVHDTTGYGEVSGAATLSQAADYWIKVKSALQGQKDYVVINLGNEPHGNTGYERWASDTSAAVRKLRGAGFDHAIIVDAPNWGQDWSGTMRNDARTVFDADPDRNTIFSIHMYGVYDTAAKVRDYLNFFVSAGLPIAIGEFGHYHTDGNPDEDAIMATAERLGLGYLGWSWSGNSGVGYLDMVNNFNTNSLTSWGRRIFNGSDGIVATAKEATIYTSGGVTGGSGPKGYF